MRRVDVAIVGAGMAGASLAAELARHASVVLIEAEERPGYHATGRSAAFWSETYGGPGVQPLTTASRDLLAAPPAEFADAGFLRMRGALHLASGGGEAALDALARAFAGKGVALRPVEGGEVAALLPGLRGAGWRGLLEPSTADIDVAALHHAYLRMARRGGVTLLCAAPLRSALREGARWRIAAGAAAIEADVLVNAAGAWADAVAAMAGAAPLGIRAYRRTVAQLRTDPPAPADLPLVMDAAGRFYFKAEAGGRAWLSPHDETPSEPCDAAPDEIDVATAIDRFRGVVDWRVEAVERRWAGLRSFAPDRLPVYGFDVAMPGFFWFAGQGGFGIQTAPAAARIGAALLSGTAPHASVEEIDPKAYAPSRLHA
ncbi:NAD(P)/FAD-dependent oxidoreductase [Sphingomonas sp.]|uniref:NAD(P)/FAD-dependent oxidoreductase n=1 Tax=Sphingomonas sp. TaxID=28214 RepID=UPI003B00D6AF